MKLRHFIAAATLAASLAPALAADISVSIGQPGFYGRLDLGGFPAPPLLFPQPVMIQPVPMGRPPLYLRVPPGHARDWRKHCYRYGACGERVYFVQDGWYQNEYAPRYRERHGHRDHDRRDYYEDRRDRGGYYEERRHDGERHGHGKGHGHGRGHDD